MKLLGPLEARLSGNLPLPGHYQLSIEIGILKGVKVKKIDKIRDKIESWVYAKAPSLAVGSPQTTPRHCVSEIFQDIPFKITLYRWEPLSPARDGKLSISRFMTNDLENKRQDRIKKAINKKCPKLLAAKNQGNGFKSVLILESNDLALANFSFIGKAFIKEIINCDNEVPDFVYLVETGISPWVVWILKDRLRNFPNISDMGPYYV